jgi:hypothetical protein
VGRTFRATGKGYNVWAIEEWRDRAKIYDHPAHDWFVQDIEPSVVVDPPAEEGIPWWRVHSLEVEGSEGVNRGVDVRPD